MTMILLGIMSAIGLLIVLFKINFWNVLKFDVLADIGITAALMIMFAGTFSGMVAAMAGGLFASVLLWLLKRLFFVR